MGRLWGVWQMFTPLSQRLTSRTVEVEVMYLTVIFVHVEARGMRKRIVAAEARVNNFFVSNECDWLDWGYLCWRWKRLGG